MTLIVLFWTQAGLFLANGALLTFNVRGRRWAGVAVSAVGVILAAGVAGYLWGIEGPCVFPHPALVPYQDGMTLCPGQATSITIPAPAGRDL